MIPGRSFVRRLRSRGLKIDIACSIDPTRYFCQKSADVSSLSCQEFLFTFYA
jgi:hypothetical protein